MADYTPRLENLAESLLRLAEQGAVTTAEIVHTLNKATERFVENAVIKGGPVPDLDADEDPVVQEATPGR
ncbi:MAG: hypothetical protein FP826_07990 [Sphingomonadales bacterium]|nr:hypothetical protein [Sphingomonadales bacterium]MBU3992189.1 hypothetical protein [Alphaproteobacteria bacterium]